MLEWGSCSCCLDVQSSILEITCQLDTTGFNNASFTSFTQLEICYLDKNLFLHCRELCQILFWLFRFFFLRWYTKWKSKSHYDTIRSPAGETDFFKIVAGVLKGATLAPYVFIACLDYVLRTSVDTVTDKGFTLHPWRCYRCPVLINQRCG